MNGCPVKGVVSEHAMTCSHYEARDVSGHSYHQAAEDTTGVPRRREYEPLSALSAAIATARRNVAAQRNRGWVNRTPPPPVGPPVLVGPVCSTPAVPEKL